MEMEDEICWLLLLLLPVVDCWRLLLLLLPVIDCWILLLLVLRESEGVRESSFMRMNEAV